MFDKIQVKINVIILWIAIIFHPNFSFAHPADINNTILKFDHYLQDVFLQSHIPGIAVAIVANNKLVYQKNLGVKQIGTNRVIDQHTIFRIASLSKAMTATLTAQLVADNVLQWDTPVSSVVKNFNLKSKDAMSKLKLFHLLNHSSGFSKTELGKSIESKNSREAIKNKLANMDLVCGVGKCFTYQNFIFDLSADVIENVTQKNFADLMKTKIFNPLKMEDSSVGSSGFVLNQNKALPHILEKNSYQLVTNEIISRYYKVNAAAGVNSSIHDMIIWLKACMGAYPKTISNQIFQTVMTPTIDIPHKRNKDSLLWEDARVNKMQYGLGWRIFDYQNNQLIFHGGALNGYSSVIGFLPDKKIGIVILSNAYTKIPSILMAKFLDLYLNLPEIDYYKLYYNK